MSLRPGRRLGDFEVLESLGKGGMGEVYRARDTRLQREVAPGTPLAIVVTENWFSELLAHFR